MAGTAAKAADRPLRVIAGILCYRSWPEVGPTIEALLRQTRQPDEIVIVDHGSEDGSVTQIRQAYPQLEVVELPGNRGPTAGYKRMMDVLLERNGDAIFTLTDDIELAPDVLELLAARMEADPRLGVVGPLIAHQRDRDRIFYAGGYIDPRTWDFEFRENPPQLSAWRGEPPREADFLGTAGTLLRAEAASAGGGPPEEFYYGFCDVDFTLRIRNLGWTLECVPAAVAWQDLGDRSREMLLAPPNPYLVARNRLGLIARNAPRRILVRELLRTGKWLVWDAVRPRSGSRADLMPRLRGAVDFSRGRWGAPPATR